ncbi:hypothetical protein RDI58_010580 [Solanum bulbocastanum]|uniref:Uncharacterized protein n=1 Tax=Solanum bulbocastanum TaxID=147425 RepID=A0AAN8YFI7_SOLBU
MKLLYQGSENNALMIDGGLNFQPSRVEIITATLWRALIHISVARNGYFRKTKMELHNFIILIRNTVNKVIALCAKASPDEIVSTLVNIYNGSVRSPERGGNKEVDKVACSSVCKFPLQDIDLGLGKPTLVYFGLKDMEIF